MKKLFLLLTLLSSGITGYCTTWIISNTGWHFTPDTITITLGDSINFTIDSTHHVVEISQASWNLNDTTPLPGFSTPMGGGLVFPSQLTLGTHWYICPEHFAEPMKAVIIVQNPTGIASLNTSKGQSIIYPNPFTNTITIDTNEESMVSIYTSSAEKIKSVLLKNIQLKNEIDVSSLPSGIYLIQFVSAKQSFASKFVKQ